MSKNFKYLAAVVIAAPAIYLLIIWNNIPDIVPMHYDLKGNIDRYGSKKEMIFLVAILTTVNALIFLLMANAHLLDPKLKASQNREKMTRIGIIISMFISAVLFMIIYTTINGNVKLFGHLVLTAVGLLLSFIGNYMYTIKPNYFAGIRLPWTLRNEENWRKTHLLAGKLWFGGGLLIAIISVFTSLQVGIISALAIILVMTIIPGIYSYGIYKEQKKFKS